MLRTRQLQQGTAGDLGCVAILEAEVIVAGSADGAVHLWQPGSSVAAQLDGHTAAVTAVERCREGFVSCGLDGRILLWAQTGVVLTVLNNNANNSDPTFLNEVNCVGVLDIGDATVQLVTGSLDRILRLWA